MHIPSLGKIRWCLLKLSSWNEKWTNGQLTDGHTDVQRETITPRHYRVEGYKNALYANVSVHKIFSGMFAIPLNILCEDTFAYKVKLMPEKYGIKC